MQKRWLSFFAGLLYSWILMFGNRLYSQEIIHRIILVGDAGELKNGKNAVIDAIRSKFPPDEKTTIVFLGDNIYPAGMPDKGDHYYPEAKRIIDYEVGLAKNTPAQAYIIPGNHDWAQGKPYGFERQIRQQRYIDSLYLSNVKAIPTDGCPGPVEVNISEKIVMIVVDTQWFLHAYDKPSIESSCPSKTADEVIASLEDMLVRNRDKLILFASHHPFRTHGPHGGYFTIKQHIFPLTDLSPGLYIPLPIIGSLYPITRGVFGNIQDTRNPLYKKMVSTVEKLVLHHPQIVFVAGHDHSLQWIKEPKANYIVSGSGANSTRVKKAKNSVFASKEFGFATLELYNNNDLRLNFFGVEDGKANLLLDSLLLTYKQFKIEPFAVLAARHFPDSVLAAPDKQYDKASGFKRFMLGNNYRKEWATELNFRTFDILRERSGLKILQRGGGHQTKSLRLEDTSGKEWVLRSMKKFPEAGIPLVLRKTFAVDIVQDQISASHPYAPLIVPTLANAANVPHTNPEIVFIPDDPMLGRYRPEFANTLALFEERTPGEGNPRTYSTENVLQEIQNDNDNVVDQEKVLRARLLDFFIADWDRHDDQWRWVDEKKGGGKKFSPLPRDRDNAFFTNSGFIPSQAKRPWLLPFVQGFRPHIKNIKGWNFGARYFDRSFLNEPGEDEWKKEVEAFTAAMTDPVIDDAVKKIPPAAYAHSGEKISSTLKERRKYLEQEALEYYRFLAKTVSVTGSDKRERFVLKGLGKDQLDVTVQKINKSGETGKEVYHRIFNAGETHELRLYGLKANDELVVEGNIPSILVRWIGGEGDDSLITSSAVEAGKKIHLYDVSTENNYYPPGNFTRSHISEDPSVNNYERKDFKYNRAAPIFTVGFNEDDGFIFGGGLKYVGHGFRKEPQAVIHEVGARYAVSTGAFAFGYRGLFTDVIGKADLEFKAAIKAPDNTINFFGFGNETVYENSGKKAYKNYRTSYTDIKTELLLRANFSETSYLGIGPAFEYYDMNIDRNTNRLISVPPFQGLDSASIYSSKMYASIQSYIDIDTRKDLIMPSRGIRWFTSAQFAKGVNDNSSDFIKLQSEFSVYLSFNIPARVIISNRIGGGTIVGDFEFFQSQTLGNSLNLRGYRNYRFSGRSSLYNNTELRLKLFDFDSYLLPGTLGLIGFFDIGRVWYKDEDSKKWHKGYGGGIYFSPVGRMIFTLTYGFSEEDQLPDFSLGFRF